MQNSSIFNPWLTLMSQFFKVFMFYVIYHFCLRFTTEVLHFYDLLCVKWKVLLRVSMVTETPPEWLMVVLVCHLLNL